MHSESGVGAGCSVAEACAQAEGMEPTSPQLLQVWAGACGPYDLEEAELYRAVHLPGKSEGNS